MVEASDTWRCRVTIPVRPQPTDTSCGPTCLQAVYEYYGDHWPLERLIGEIPSIEGGGTLAVLLGIHALRHGYRATLYAYNLQVFDPSWFEPELQDLREKLRLEAARRTGKRKQAVRACHLFTELGGEIRFQDLTGALIRQYLRRGIPILTGLSATFLYRAKREDPDTDRADDVGGEPQGHFVVLSGYHPKNQTVIVADPYAANPLSPERTYEVSIERLVNAILLGVLTYDGNLLIIRPRVKLPGANPLTKTRP